MPVYYVKGSGTKVTLTDKNFVARGGEKSVYHIGGTAYCVYHDPKNAIPAGKITELASLTMPEIVRPTAELLDANQKHCGETMPFVTDSVAPNDSSVAPVVLCHLFTNSFRKRHGVTEKHITKITDAMLAVTRHCHQHGVVLVDPNETNWLVKSSLDDVFLIDTSCVQTASYPGTAIKPAIHDWNAGRHFTPQSDYFSLAVVLGWLWVGVHPYMTYHPKWEGTKLDPAQVLEQRMRKNCSFFDPETELNRACRRLEDIPSGLRDWLKAVLQDGKRLPPPNTCGEAVVVLQTAAAVVSSNSYVTITELARFASDIVRVFGSEVSHKLGEVVVHTPLRNTVVRAAALKGMLDGVPEITCRAKAVIESHGRLLVVADDSVSEIVFNEFSTTKLRATIRYVGSIADVPTTRVFRGCVLQSLLGRYLLSIFPEPGQCRQHQLRELEGWQVLDAGYESGVLLVMAESGGQYRLWRYRFDGEKSDSVVLSDQFGDVNFAVTDNGVCAILLPNGDLLACRSKSGVAGEKRVVFPSPDMLLFARGAHIVGAVGPVLYKVSLT